MDNAGYAETDGQLDKMKEAEMMVKRRKRRRERDMIASQIT